MNDFIQKASRAYVEAYGETLMTFGERHERAIAESARVTLEARDAEWREGLHTSLPYWDQKGVDAMASAIIAGFESAHPQADAAVEAVTTLLAERGYGEIGSATGKQIVAAVRRADASAGEERGGE